MTADAGRCGAVVALKPLPHAKSRMDRVNPLLRRQLAWCMAVDTVRALVAGVDEVVVVSDQPNLAVRLRSHGLIVRQRPDVPGGLNAALAFGGEALSAAGCRTVLACVADLPALRASSVRRVVAASAGSARTFLADTTGIGTTMLIARDSPLAPRFSGRSAAAHRASGAVALTDDRIGAPVPDARRDVDTEIELADAFRLGVGPATLALLDPATGRLRD